MNDTISFLLGYLTQEQIDSAVREGYDKDTIRNIMREAGWEDGYEWEEEGDE